MSQVALDLLFLKIQKIHKKVWWVLVYTKSKRYQKKIWWALVYTKSNRHIKSLVGSGVQKIKDGQTISLYFHWALVYTKSERHEKSLAGTGVQKFKECLRKSLVGNGVHNKIKDC